MFILKLEDIIFKNDFAMIKMGMSENECIQILGNPNETAGNNRIDDSFGSVTMNYGGYEFSFFDDVLYYFQNDHFRFGCIEFENKHFKLDTWILNEHKTISLAKFMSELKSRNIAYEIKEIIQENNEDNYTLVKLSTGMKIEFDNKELLYAIRYSNFG